jgi:adenylate cyclase
VAVHPEDRLFSSSTPNPNIVVVGIDDSSVRSIGQFPLPRTTYALVLRNLEAAGAAVVAFDVGFPDPRDPSTDSDFAKALRDSTIPVVLSYEGEESPLKKFWCADANTNPSTPCQSPYKNVMLASTEVDPDSDGVVRRIPMFVEPACYIAGTCSSATVNPIGFAAYRAFSLLPDPSSGPTLQEAG